MIVGAAVCPGAPFLIGGTADAIAGRLQPITRACAEAITLLPAADALLLITASAATRPPARPPDPGRPAWRLLVPGTTISTTPLRRSDRPDPRPVTLSSGTGDDAAVGGAVVRTTPSVATIVGASLLADCSRPGDPAAPTTAVEIMGDPVEVAGMLAGRVESTGRLSVLVIADGSACHGDDAPGHRDDRAAAFDADLAAALAAGDPEALIAATSNRESARELLATVDPLAVLALLTRGNPPTTTKLLYSGAPLGVGYLIAAWRWSDA